MRDFSFETEVKEIILQFNARPAEEVLDTLRDKITCLEYEKTSSIGGRKCDFEFHYENVGYFYVILDREKQYATKIEYECRGPAYNYYALKFLSVFLIKNNTSMIPWNPKTFKYLSEENFEIQIGTAINSIIVTFTDIDMKQYTKCNDPDPENEEYPEFDDDPDSEDDDKDPETEEYPKFCDTPIENGKHKITIEGNKYKVTIKKNGKIICELKN